MSFQDLRRAAHAEGKKTFYTGLPCKRGHLAERYVSNAGCVGCMTDFKRTAINSITKTLMPFAVDRMFVPHDMTPEQCLALTEYMHACITSWVQHQGMLTPERAEAYAKGAADRAQKAKVP